MMSVWSAPGLTSEERGEGHREREAAGVSRNLVMFTRWPFPLNLDYTVSVSDQKMDIYLF